MNEIEKLKECFVEQLLPIRVYLFGSFANNTYNSESDLDFYIVVQDDIRDILAETAKAYKAIRKIKQHPLDIFQEQKPVLRKEKKYLLQRMKYIEGDFYMMPETKEWYDMAIMDLGVIKESLNEFE